VAYPSVLEARLRDPTTTQLIQLAPPTPAGKVALGITVAMVLLPTAGFTLMCMGLQVTGALLTDPVVAILAGVLAALFGAPYLAIIHWIDRNEKEPWYLVLSALVWGGVLATGLSGIFNSMFGYGAFLVVQDEAFAHQLSASLSAPFIEEITKGAALWLIYLFFHKEFDNVLDGVIYGALVGLGFAVYENWSYYVNQENGVAGVVLLTWIRGVVCAAGGSHATFTALTGLGFGLFRVMRRGALRWVLPPLGLAGAMFLHFCWNTFAAVLIGVIPGGDVGGLLIGLPLAVVVIQVPFLAFVLLTAFFALRHESRMIRTYLADERPPVAHPEEVQRLLPARRRTLHSLTLFLTFRFQDWWRTRQRNHLLVRLAFEKWHMAGELRGEDLPDAGHHASRIRELRRQLTDYQVSTG
jgi:RsiW-degrading membrane proteinase PrsW (M82 family)